MRTFLKHYVNDMDPTIMVQRCIFCGETISDYSNVMYPLADGPPKGFPAGAVYVSKGFPSITQTEAPEAFKDCRVNDL